MNPATALTIQTIDGTPTVIEAQAYAKYGRQHCAVTGGHDEDATVRDTIRDAFAATGTAWPQDHVTVNLSPATARKDTQACALATAAAILAATGTVPRHAYRRTILTGTLHKDGTVTRTDGIETILAEAVRQRIPRAAVPADNLDEARRTRGIRIIPVRDLADVIAAAETVSEPIDPTRPEYDTLRTEVTGYITAYWQEAADGHPYYASQHPGRSARGMALDYMRERYDDYARDLKDTDPDRYHAIIDNAPHPAEDAKDDHERFTNAFDDMFDLIWPSTDRDA